MVNLSSTIRVLVRWFPVDSDGKESARNAGDLGLILGSRRSPGEGNGNPFQYSYLDSSMDRGAWQATVHGVAQRIRHDWATNTSLFTGHIYVSESEFLHLNEGIIIFFLIILLCWLNEIIDCRKLSRNIGWQQLLLYREKKNHSSPKCQMLFLVVSKH